MTDSDTRRAGIAGLATLAVVGLVGFVLLTGDESGQLAAGGVVMAGALALGLIQGYRSQETLALVGAGGLAAGGAYGVYLSAAGRDPFTDHVVLGLVVVGLVAGLFTPSDEEDSDEDGDSGADGDDGQSSDTE